MSAGEGWTADRLGQALEAQKRQIDAERRARFKPFGLTDACLWPAARIFHEHSALGPAWAATLTVAEVEALTRNLDYKRHPTAERLALPVAPPLEAGLERILRERQSVRAFKPGPVSMMALAKLLELGGGVTKRQEVPRRAAPSSGGLYPIELYVAALDVEGLGVGLYHYLPLSHELECLRPLTGIGAMAEFLPPDLLDARPPLVLALTVVFPRVQTKYLERGYRFALLEAGHIAQNLLLIATALGLGGVPVGGFWDEPFNEFLGLQQDIEAVVYALLLGSPDAESDV